MHKISIKRLKSYYGRLSFTERELKIYFQFSLQEEAFIGALKKASTKLMFMLQLGIFKKYQRFLKQNELYRQSRPIDYLLKSYFQNYTSIDLKITDRACRNHKHQILQLTGYRPFDNEAGQALKCHLEQASLNSISEEDLLQSALEFLRNESIAYPENVQVFQLLLIEVISEYRSKAVKKFNLKLRKKTKAELSSIILNHDLLSTLKTTRENYSVSEVKKEIKLKISLRGVSKSLTDSLHSAEIVSENVKIFATQFLESPIGEGHFPIEDRFFLLTSFLKNREQESNEYLINAYKFHLEGFLRKENEFKQNKIIGKKVNFDKYLKLVPQILNLIVGSEFSDDTPFSEVRERLFELVPEDTIEELLQALSDNILIDRKLEKEFYEDRRNSIEGILRKILEVLNFETSSYQNLLLKATDNDTRGKNLKVYKRVLNKILSGEIYKYNTMSFKNIESDLLDKKVFQNQKEKLIIKSGLTLLNTSIESHLEDLDQELRDLYDRINDKIAKGDIGISSSGNMINLTRIGQSAAKSWELSNILENTKQRSISEVLEISLNAIAPETCFFHTKNGNNYNRPSPLLSATLLATGTNIGVYKMGKISNLDYKSIKAVAANYLNIQNLQDANRVLIEKIEELPIFKYYYMKDGIIHSSSDGQKFETQFDNLNSRYSSKYFGLNKGITNYTLVGNQIPLNAKVISSNEYEGHNVLDLLLGNDTGIDPEFHSTDGHGINQVNFGLLNLFGYQFAPRIKNFSSHKYSLCSFDSPEKYKDYKVRPSQKINRPKIVKNWEEIQRIVLSLKNKKVSQSVIVKKLSSHKRNCEIKSALWEYNDILRSIFILNCLESETLRQNIQKSLNIGENYHQMMRAIAFGGNKGLKARNEHSQKIWSESARFIANSIIFYNSQILSFLLKSRFIQSNGLKKDQVITSSPVAWSHINLMGHYEFKTLKNVNHWKSEIKSGFVEQ